MTPSVSGRYYHPFKMELERAIESSNLSGVTNLSSLNMKQKIKRLFKIDIWTILVYILLIGQIIYGQKLGIVFITFLLFLVLKYMCLFVLPNTIQK